MIYDSDIAERLCTPSELKRKRGDELPPNSRERDPPRVCGENPIYTEVPSYKCGSPPRVRGKQVAAAVQQVAARITPARAGKTAQP